MIPYWTRADIESGKAPGAGMQELVWVDDPVEAFFLQIQGRGACGSPKAGDARRLRGSERKPLPLDRPPLVERGELTLDKASMQGIKDMGSTQSRKLCALLDENPSYVFFREVPPPAPGTLEGAIDGPIGTLGVPLLRERTSPSIRARFRSARPCSSQRRSRCRRGR